MALPAELAVADLVWNDSGKEIAVNRIWLQHEHHDTVEFNWGDALQTIADKFVESLGTADTGGQIMSYISNQVTLTRVDAYQIGTDGHATDKRTSTPSTTVGGSATGNHIPLVGAVVQLWGYNPASFVQHARRHRGRLFAPGTPASLFTATGELPSGTADDIAERWASFLNDIQGMHVGESAGLPGGPTDSMNVGILSRVDQAFRQLEAVTCAYKPGTQHRRMNKLPNTRSTSSSIDHS